MELQRRALYPDPQAAAGERGLVWAFETLKPTPTHLPQQGHTYFNKPHLLIPPKQNLGLSMQIHEPMGTILIQITTFRYIVSDILYVNMILSSCSRDL